MLGTARDCPDHRGLRHAWTGETAVRWAQGIVFSSSFVFFFLALLRFILMFIPLPIAPFQAELTANRDCNIYSSRRPARQSCLCCTEESPLCASQLSINLEPLPLRSETIITRHDSLSVLVSLPLSPPAPPLPSSPSVNVIYSGLCCGV